MFVSFFTNISIMSFIFRIKIKTKIFVEFLVFGFSAWQHQTDFLFCAFTILCGFSFFLESRFFNLFLEKISVDRKWKSRRDFRKILMLEYEKFKFQVFER